MTRKKNRKTPQGEWPVPEAVRGGTRMAIEVNDFLGALGEWEDGPWPLAGYAISLLCTIMAAAGVFAVLGLAGVSHALAITTALAVPCVVFPGAMLIIARGFDIRHGKERKLMLAVSDGDPEKVNAALAEGANPNGCGLEFPLHIVAGCGDWRAVRTLLAAGADPNVQDGKGNTAALLASIKGFGDVVEALRKDGRTRMDIRNDCGQSALDFIHRVGEPHHPGFDAACSLQDFDAVVGGVFSRPPKLQPGKKISPPQPKS